MSDELNSPGVQRMRAVLDDSVAGLDAATLSRLNRARQGALKARPSRQRYVLPIGMALAASLMLALLVVRLQPESTPAPVVRVDVPKPAVVPAPAPVQQVLPVNAPEVVAAPVVRTSSTHEAVPEVGSDTTDLPDDLLDLPGDGPDELAQEDLEFYAWLDAQEAQDG